MKTDLESDGKGTPPVNIPIDLEVKSKESNKLDIKPLPSMTVKPEPRAGFSAPPIPSPKTESPRPHALPTKPLQPQPIRPVAPLRQNIEAPSKKIERALPPIPTNLPSKKEELFPPSPRLKPIKEIPTRLGPNNLEQVSQNSVVKQVNKPPKTTSLKKSPARRIIILSILAFVIVLFILGEIWWFFIASTPEPTPPPENLFPTPEETLPPSQPEETLPPPQEEEPAVITPEIPSALLSYDETIEVNLSELTSEEMGMGISQVISEIASENSLNRVVFVSDLDQTVLDLETFLSLSGIIMPESISSKLSGSYDLFFLGENSFDRTSCSKAGISSNACAGPRLGLVLSVKSGENIDSSLKLWENTMASDLQSILPSQTSISSGNFKNASYGGASIRYQNFPIDTTTIDYAVLNNVLLISTSKTSMYAIVDALR
jgi:hypothetical protein